MKNNEQLAWWQSYRYYKTIINDKGGTCRDVFYFLGYVIFRLFTYANLLFYSIFQLKQYISISK